MSKMNKGPVLMFDTTFCLDQVLLYWLWFNPDGGMRFNCIHVCVCCAICESFPFDAHEFLLDYCHMVLAEAPVYFLVRLHSLEFISF